MGYFPAKWQAATGQRRAAAARLKEEGNAAIVANYNNKYSGFSWFKDLGSGFHYIVPAGDLGVSVATYTGLALACVAVLMTRRRIAGGELGGPNRLRYMSAALLVSFWLIYIIVSSINAYAQK